MAQQSRLEVLLLERLSEQRILLEIEHAETQVHGGMEPLGHLVDLILAQRLLVDGRARLGVDGPSVLLFGQAVGSISRHIALRLHGEGIHVVASAAKQRSLGGGGGDGNGNG